MEKNFNLPKIKLNNISIITISILLIVFLIADRTILASIETAIPAYIISLLSVVFGLGYFAKFGTPRTDMKNIFAILLIYMLFLAIYSVFTDINDIKHSLRIFVYTSMLFLFGFAKLDKTKLILIVSIFSGFTLVIFFQWLSSLETFKYTGFFENPNTLGIIMYNIIFFHVLALFLIKGLIGKVIIKAFIMIDLILLYVSTSRAVWLSLVVAVLVFFLYRLIIINRLIYRLSFIVTLFSIITFSYLYPKLYTMEIGWKINEFILKYTGKSFFTGRQNLWSQLITIIESKPFIGNGLSVSARDLIQIDLGAHNMYLNTLLQTGMIGLILYCLILFFIWDMLYPKANDGYKNSHVLRLFPAFFAGLVIYQGFEMSFIQGGYSISMFEWLFIAIGIGLLNINKGYNVASSMNKY